MVSTNTNNNAFKEKRDDLYKIAFYALIELVDRNLAGKLLKQFGRLAVLDAIALTKRHAPVDKKKYLLGVLYGRKKATVHGSIIQSVSTRLHGQVLQQPQVLQPTGARASLPRVEGVLGGSVCFIPTDATATDLRAEQCVSGSSLVAARSGGIYSAGKKLSAIPLRKNHSPRTAKTDSRGSQEGDRSAKNRR